MKSNGKVTVVWLDNGEVTSDFAVSICDIFRAQSHVINGRVIVRSGGAITRGRNSSIATFLTSSDDEWALLVDSDMSFPIETFEKVLEAAPAQQLSLDTLSLELSNSSEYVSFYPYIFLSMR